jgi:hypothetical protein
MIGMSTRPRAAAGALVSENAFVVQAADAAGNGASTGRQVLGR